MTVCTHDSLARGGLFGHVKSGVRKIGFSRGVALPYAPMSLAGEGGLFGHAQIWSHTKVV